MSISKIGKMSSGCVYVFSFLVLASMAGVYFAQAGRAGGGQEHQTDQDQHDDSPVVAQIDDYKITSQMIDRDADQEGQSLGGPPNPQQLAELLGRAADRAVDQALHYKLIEENGVTIDDQDIANAVDQDIESRLFNYRIQMSQSGDIDSKATDDQLKAELKKRGVDLDKLRSESVADLQKAYKDPAKKAQVIAAVGTSKLLDALASKIPVTDEQLKKNLDQVTYKRILIRSIGTTPPTDKAKDVLRALDGGMSFDAAMDKYSGEPPLPKKSVHDNGVTVARKDVPPDVQAALDPLKPGQHSGPIANPEGLSIYELVSVKPIDQKEFEKQKAAAHLAYGKAHAADLEKKGLDELKAKKGIQWTEPVYEAIYKLGVLTATPTGHDPKKDLEDCKAIAKTCADTKATDGGVLRDAAVTRYAAFELIYQKSSQAEQKKMADEHIEVLENLFGFMDDTQERINLAELYADKKNAQKASENLIEAAQRNLNEMNNAAESFTANTRIVTLEARLENEKLISPEDKATIEKAIADYREAYKAQEDEKKKEADEERKAKEEEEKEKQKDLQKSIPSPRSSAAPSASPSPSASAPPHNGKK